MSQDPVGPVLNLSMSHVGSGKSLMQRGLLILAEDTNPALDMPWTVGKTDSNNMKPYLANRLHPSTSGLRHVVPYPVRLACLQRLPCRLQLRAKLISSIKCLIGGNMHFLASNRFHQKDFLIFANLTIEVVRNLPVC